MTTLKNPATYNQRVADGVGAGIQRGIENVRDGANSLIATLSRGVRAGENRKTDGPMKREIKREKKREER